MKKLKLKMTGLKADVLTRAQLKAVMGGQQAGSGDCGGKCGGAVGCGTGCKCSNTDFGLCVSE
ncbi:hypothetical protein SAMN05421820_11765 [Pedobacter steynii]|uniref:Uncharacterized protein n=1 Tax=Pedobacter steynii TaxID=430522 RepID=A0A1H0L713_9SPHI|nr:hypothetical protein SAMN05421820_11765 [Pedobacter steynii]